MSLPIYGIDSRAHFINFFDLVWQLGGQRLRGSGGK